MRCCPQFSWTEADSLVGERTVKNASSKCIREHQLVSWNVLWNDVGARDTITTEASYRVENWGAFDPMIDDASFIL
jgi:hypothetical protein